MAPPNPVDIALKGAQTVRAFGQRIPGAGNVLARSLEDAVKNRDIVAAKMTLDQLTEAQRLAREWKPKA